MVGNRCFKIPSGKRLLAGKHEDVIVKFCWNILKKIKIEIKASWPSTIDPTSYSCCHSTILKLTGIAVHINTATNKMKTTHTGFKWVHILQTHDRSETENESIWNVMHTRIERRYCAGMKSRKWIGTEADYGVKWSND